MATQQVLVTGWIVFNDEETTLERETDALFNTGLNIQVLTEGEYERNQAMRHSAQVEAWIGSRDFPGLEDKE